VRILAVVAVLAAGKLHVVVTGQDHHPRVGKHWHYEVHVTNAAGKPVRSRIHLQFLFGAIPVGEVGRHLLPRGVWEETFGTPGNPAFPAAARGQRLTLQATATAKGYAQAKGGWVITVK